MKNLKKEDIQQEVFDLYDDYAHNKFNRRQFVEKLSLYAIGGLTVGSLLSFMSPDYVTTLLISKDDPRLDSGYIQYDSPKGGGSIRHCYPLQKIGQGNYPELLWCMKTVD